MQCPSTLSTYTPWDGNVSISFWAESLQNGDDVHRHYQLIQANSWQKFIGFVKGCVSSQYSSWFIRQLCYDNSKPDRQWRSSSFQESKKVRVSRDIWPWPWPWAHPGCTLTRIPSCASLVAIRPFAWEKKRFSCQHKSAHITWPLTLTLTLSTTWMHADLESMLWMFGGDPAICLREEVICAKVYRQTDGQTTDASPLYKLILGMS